MEVHGGNQPVPGSLESGDLELADRCIEEMLDLIGDLRQPTVESYLRMRQSVRHIVAGEMDEGERLATLCFELAQAAGQPDAYTFYFAQLLNLRYHQGRMHEIVPVFEKEVAQNPGLPSQQGGLAIAYCELDEYEKARPLMEDLADRSEQLHRDLSWLVTMACTTDACFRLEDTERAAHLYPQLAPFRDQFVDNATNWFGSMQRFLGMLEHCAGDYGTADASFAEAERLHIALPAPAMLARTRLDWATSLLGRPIPDTLRAKALLEATVPEAERMGLSTVSRRSSVLLSS